jgi:hypothetical protein
MVGVAGLEPTTSWSQTRHATNCAKPRFNIKTAEEAGFEPAVPFARYVSLANWWFQPLTHPSV